MICGKTITCKMFICFHQRDDVTFLTTMCGTSRGRPKNKKLEKKVIYSGLIVCVWNVAVYRLYCTNTNSYAVLLSSEMCVD